MVQTNQTTLKQHTSFCDQPLILRDTKLRPNHTAVPGDPGRQNVTRLGRVAACACALHCCAAAASSVNLSTTQPPCRASWSKDLRLKMPCTSKQPEQRHPVNTQHEEFFCHAFALQRASVLCTHGKQASWLHVCSLITQLTVDLTSARGSLNSAPQQKCRHPPACCTGLLLLPCCASLLAATPTQRPAACPASRHHSGGGTASHDHAPPRTCTSSQPAV
jgi:hypothetical protein